MCLVFSLTEQYIAEEKVYWEKVQYFVKQMTFAVTERGGEK